MTNLNSENVQKIYLHDQEMAGEGTDETNIPPKSS